MTLANSIRAFVNQTYIIPAKDAGEKMVEICARYVHAQLSLDNRMPAVCGALDAKKFSDFYGVELIYRGGPHQGANAVWTFKI